MFIYTLNFSTKISLFVVFAFISLVFFYYFAMRGETTSFVQQACMKNKTKQKQKKKRKTYFCQYVPAPALWKRKSLDLSLTTLDSVFV